MSAPGIANLYDKDDNLIATMHVNAGWVPPATHAEWIAIVSRGFAHTMDVRLQHVKMNDKDKERYDEFNANKHKWFYCTLWDQKVTRSELEAWELKKD